MRASPFLPSLLRPHRPVHFRTPRPRNTSTNTPPPPPPSSDINTAKKVTRAEQILSKFPRPLQKYTTSLRSAPTTHVVAFLILHEITAIVPLLGLVGVFHYGNWLPLDALGDSDYVKEGVERFERYFRRKGWLPQEDGEGGPQGGVLEHWRENGRYRLVVEVGLAWALCKVLLPVRIGVSLWGTPWMAGWIGRVKGQLAKNREDVQLNSLTERGFAKLGSGGSGKVHCFSPPATYTAVFHGGGKVIDGGELKEADGLLGLACRGFYEGWFGG
ncbi:hypothetical protein QBC36DRAFT_236248 [Triangularia setosa]|uniref:Uncharacterized protein n=1 Tax=Triangularia setosa TaxID=2587417 RepID=A0AAN6W9P6_9PEZI|nr:hypothetical protein QBC36DRAFT_236248 [Podospora setosa]